MVSTTADPATDVWLAHETRALAQRGSQFLASRGIRGLENVEVIAHGGTVGLHGEVPSLHDRWPCVHCAGRVHGTRYVVDELEVTDERPEMRRQT